MKKPLTLTALIILIITQILNIVLMAEGIYLLQTPGLNEQFTSESLIQISTICSKSIFYSVILIIIASICISAWKDPIKYKKRYGWIVFLLVLSIFRMIAYILDLSTITGQDLQSVLEVSETLYQVLMIVIITEAVSAFFSLFIIIFLSVDIGRHKKYMKTIENNSLGTTTNVPYANNYGNNANMSYQNQNNLNNMNYTANSTNVNYNNSIYNNKNSVNNNLANTNKVNVKDLDQDKLKVAREKAKKYKAMLDSGEITQEEFYTLLDKVKKDLTNN